MLSHRITRRRWLYGATGGAISLLAACNRGKLADNRPESTLVAPDAPQLTLTSPSLQAAFIPPQFTCDGANQSLALNWSAPPANTQSWVVSLVAVSSSEVPSKVHWLLYDLPASLRELPAGLPNQPFLSQGGLQAKNDFGRYGYRGPCGEAASYLLTLYALKSLLDLPPGTPAAEVSTALQPQLLAEARLTLRYRPPATPR